MKKSKLIWFLSFILLAGCQQKTLYVVDFYYVETCPKCQAFKEYVIPKLEDEYGSQMKINYYNIDDEESIEQYVKTVSLLENYEVDDEIGSVPFIVFDGYFAKFGYDSNQEEALLEAFDLAIHNQKLPTELKDIYLFKEGQSIY